MTHEDAGKYAAKHPPGAPVNEQIGAAIRENSSRGGLTCAASERISQDLGVRISEVGTTVDLLEIKIRKCQLGLFGYGEKPHHGKDIRTVDSVAPEMNTALTEAAENGTVTCAALWAIADRLGAERKAVSGACETLKIKIRECQLGAF